MAAIKRCPWKGNVNYLKIRGIILKVIIYYFALSLKQ